MFASSRISVLRQARALNSPRPVSQASLSALARLLSTLALLEQREGKLQPAALHAITAAQKIGGPVTGIIAGSSVKSVAEEASKIKGLEKILMIENGDYDKVR
jgi:electron transfer flavoprotein alpha subunit